jgi:hypothetical protein
LENLGQCPDLEEGLMTSVSYRFESAAPERGFAIGQPPIGRGGFVCQAFRLPPFEQLKILGLLGNSNVLQIQGRLDDVAFGRIESEARQIG